MASYEFENLVVVAAHAAFRSEYQPHEVPAQPFTSPECWTLEPYQTPDELPMLAEHLRTGLEIAASTPGSLLVLSAGFTRPDSVGGSYNWSDAHSYLVAGRESRWYDQTAYRRLTHKAPGGVEFDIALHSLMLREPVTGTHIGEVTVALSDYARDSLEEELGGLAAFCAVTDTVPQTVTEVGWAFKEQRLKMHAKVIGIPNGRFRYVGVGNPPSVEDARVVEQRTVGSFALDEFGLTGDLAAKRIARDPLNRGNPHWHMLRTIQAMLAA